MAFYRHFVERSDFTLLLATDDPQVGQHKLPFPVVCLKAPKWVERMCRTRLSLWAHSFKHLLAGRFLPKGLLSAVREFKPDIVFTVAGSWFWTANLAERVARRVGAPLVGSFNDWFDYNILIHRAARGLLERRFRRFYDSCDLALCTCEGMREELGSHPNPHILYPMGARLSESLPSLQEARFGSETSSFVVAFAGNLGNWYGRMLEELVVCAWRQASPIEFRFFGSNPSWSSEFDREVRARGIYRGQVSFSQLQTEMACVDGLLLLMGFGEDCALIERTSFKTKFLDYLAFQRPILLWGPQYCSASRIAREFDSAQICADTDAVACLQSILAVHSASDRQKVLVQNARKMYEGRFHPDKIHAGFVRSIKETVEAFRA